GAPARDCGVRKLVRQMHVLRHPVLAHQVAMKAWRKLAGDPAVGAVNARLVDGAPDADEVSQLVHDAMHKGHERARRTARCPAPLTREPPWVREMVQGDHGRDALLAQLAENVSVVTDLPRIELSL